MVNSQKRSNTQIGWKLEGRRILRGILSRWNVRSIGIRLTRGWLNVPSKICIDNIRFLFYCSIILSIMKEYILIYHQYFQYNFTTILFIYTTAIILQILINIDNIIKSSYRYFRRRKLRTFLVGL